MAAGAGLFLRGQAGGESSLNKAGYFLGLGIGGGYLDVPLEVSI